MSGEIQIVETRESEQFQLLQGGKVAFYFDCELAIWAFIHGRISFNLRRNCLPVEP